MLYIRTTRFLGFRLWLRENVGLRWWMIFRDGSCIGPMSYAHVIQGRLDGWVYRVQWSRETPCVEAEQL